MATHTLHYDYSIRITGSEDTLPGVWLVNLIVK